MDAQQLTYPESIHALYRKSVLDFQRALCRGELDMDKDGPLLQVECPAGCQDHKVEINVQAIKSHIIKVNGRAHGLLKEQLATLPQAEQITYHDALLDVSRHYFPVFDEWIAKKERLLLHNRHLSWRQQKQERNHAIEMLIVPEQVPAAHLFEFVACYRKRSYLTQQEAATALSSGEHGFDDNNTVYACSHCPGWHVGHALSKTAPLEYRLSRARMVWATQRALANRFACERNLLAMRQTY